ncbi:MAG: transcriptional repressor LexA [Cellvibrionales bacterium]|nr:transcriptional repressor LexA [Cellvibrionales bacterium]
MIKLTKRQEEILTLIKSHLRETGLPPTRAEIAKAFGFRSPNAAEEHLKALAKKGVIEMIPGASRGIRLTQDDTPEGLPIVGKVAAGEPLISDSHIQSHCEIPPSFFSPSADYLLEVEGDSMVDIGVLDGDLLAVHNTNQANNGDVIVARVDDEVTVKRLKKHKESWKLSLLAENKAYSPIPVNLKTQSFSIEGIMVGIIRR